MEDDMGYMGPDMGDEGNSDDILAAYGNENDEEEAVAEGSMDDLNQEELEAIIESITSGKSQSFKKL